MKNFKFVKSVILPGGHYVYYCFIQKGLYTACEDRLPIGLNNYTHNTVMDGRDDMWGGGWQFPRYGEPYKTPSNYQLTTNAANDNDIL